VQYRNLGASGLKVSVLGLGSWLTMGTTIDAAATRRIVSLARDSGINLLDTADVYNAGAAEQALAVVLAELPRHQCVVATKCFFPMSDDPNDRGLSRKHIHESARKSLRRLGTDYIDLYQCHRFDPDVPLLETARAMDDLIRQGHVLYWGVSQFSAQQIADVVALCRRERLQPPISNQPLYNLFDRDIELDVLPVGAENGVGQLAYSPLAQGVLTAKYAPGRKPAAGTRATDKFEQSYRQLIDRGVSHDHGRELISGYMTSPRLRQAAALAELAAGRGLTATQLALAFCMRDERISSVLVGARNEEQLSQNLAATDVRIDDGLLAELDRLFPPKVR